MEDPDTNPRASGRNEPTSFSLADLSMLVIGFALAFSLPQLHHLADRITIYDLPMPGWVVCLLAFREAAMKGGLILAPVIVARRAQYGGLPRSADWLAILVVLPLLHELIQRSDWIKRFARWYLVDLRSSLGYPAPPLMHERYPSRGIMFGKVIRFGYEGFPIDFTPGEEGRIWGWFATILLLVISTSLGLGWKRTPAWAKTALLPLMALTWLAGVTYLLFPGLGRTSHAIAAWTGLPSGIIFQIALGLGRLPENLLFGIPIVAALFELRTGGSRTWAWIGWVGATIAFLSLPIDAATYWYADLINLSDPIAVTRLGVQALQLIAVGLISWMVVKTPGGAGAEPAGS